MKDRIVELLVQIMSEIQEKNRLSELDLGALQKKGYTQSEISEALSWLYDNMQVDDGIVVSPIPSTVGRRVFHDIEKSALSIESQGYLIQLRELGLLDDRDFETVVERAMQTGFERLSVEEVREIVAMLLSGKGGPSNRSWVNSRESIH